MARQPIIYLSAATRDLDSLRQQVAKLLTARGCRLNYVQSALLTSAAAGGGAEQECVRSLISSSDLVLQIVGYRDTPFLQGTSPNGGRVYLHGFEFDTAMQLGKPVHPIFLTDEFPTDPVESESDPELQERHLYWRTFMRSDHLLYIPGDEAELTLHLQRMHLGPYYPSAMVSSSANSNSLSLPS